MRSFQLWLSHKAFACTKATNLGIKCPLVQQQGGGLGVLFYPRSLFPVCFIPPKQRQADLTSLGASVQQSASRAGQQLRDGRVHELRSTSFLVQHAFACSCHTCSYRAHASCMQGFLYGDEHWLHRAWALFSCFRWTSVLVARYDDGTIQ